MYFVHMTVFVLSFPILILLNAVLSHSCQKSIYNDYGLKMKRYVVKDII
jgi:hypothetical protein